MNVGGQFISGADRIFQHKPAIYGPGGPYISGDHIFRDNPLLIIKIYDGPHHVRMTWVRMRGAWLADSLVVAVGLQDSTSAERVERERGRGVEQSSRKRWREEISSVQFSGTTYGEGGALYTSAHTHSAEEEEEERASRALSLVRALRANRFDHASAICLMVGTK